MKPIKTSKVSIYRAALAYYQRTVWTYVSDTPLGGAQYAVAVLAWHRLFKAHSKWFASLRPDKQAKARADEPNMESLRPLRLQRDEGLTPETLASLASARLGTTKPKSFNSAVMETHQLLSAARTYLDSLPSPRANWENALDAYVENTVSFSDIINSSAITGSIALLPTVQPKRHEGKLTPKALEQAVKRYGDSRGKEIQEQIRLALKNKVISCHHLEKIRWQRFRPRRKSS